MKANRKFIDGEEAVSAVIGVILMVAITVAIAATVYVYVSGMIGTQETTPTVQFLADESEDRLTVIDTDADVEWTKVAYRASEATVIYVNDEVSGATGDDVPANSRETITAGTHISGAADIGGSDFIDIEGGAGGAGVDKTDVVVTITWIDTEVVLGTFTFSSIDATDAT